jgi:hypothetical protein
MMSTAKDQLSQSEKPLQKLWENLKHQFLNSLWRNVSFRVHFSALNGSLLKH